LSSRIDDAEDLQGVRLALASVNEARKAGGWGRSEPCRIEKIMHRVLDKQEGEVEGMRKKSDWAFHSNAFNFIICLLLAKSRHITSLR